MDLVPPALFQYLFPVRSSSTCLETVGQRLPTGLLVFEAICQAGRVVALPRGKSS